MITKGIKELCQEAEKEIETLNVNDVMLISENEDTADRYSRYTGVVARWNNSWLDTRAAGDA